MRIRTKVEIGYIHCHLSLQRRMERQGSVGVSSTSKEESATEHGLGRAYHLEQTNIIGEEETTGALRISIN